MKPSNRELSTYTYIRLEIQNGSTRTVLIGWNRELCDTWRKQKTQSSFQFALRKKNGLLFLSYFSTQMLLTQHLPRARQSAYPHTGFGSFALINPTYFICIVLFLTRIH